MTSFGYTLMCEQSSPRSLVTDAIAAEAAGFDYAVMSDHFSPWLEDQGHSPAAWPLLGAVAQATSRLPLMTYVTCPTFRYHPAVIAQQAATVALLSDGRFLLGLGAGENLNEHVVGGGWPSVDHRHERLREAVEVIRALWDGGYVNYQGRHFTVDSAKLYDRPNTPPPLGIAASGAQSCALAGEVADLLIAVAPEGGLVRSFASAGGQGKPVYGQMPISYDTDEEKARRVARDQWRWAAAGWKVMAELPGPAGFDAYSQYVREDDLADIVSCGPDVATHVAAARRWIDAGFTHLAFVQVGGDRQAEFLRWANDELLPALRKL